MAANNGLSPTVDGNRLGENHSRIYLSYDQSGQILIELLAFLIGMVNFPALPAGNADAADTQDEQKDAQNGGRCRSSNKILPSPGILRTIVL